MSPTTSSALTVTSNTGVIKLRAWNQGLLMIICHHCLWTSNRSTCGQSELDMVRVRQNRSGRFWFIVKSLHDSDFFFCLILSYLGSLFDRTPGCKRSSQRDCVGWVRRNRSSCSGLYSRPSPCSGQCHTDWRTVSWCILVLFCILTYELINPLFCFIQGVLCTCSC